LVFLVFMFAIGRTRRGELVLMLVIVIAALFKRDDHEHEHEQEHDYDSGYLVAIALRPRIIPSRWLS